MTTPRKGIGQITMLPSWDCPQCGKANTSGQTCQSCGAPRDDSALPTMPFEAEAPAESSSRVFMDRIFFLDPENRKFLEGTAKKVRMGANTPSGCMYFFLMPFIMAGVFLISFSVREWNKAIELSNMGVNAQGTVTRLEIDDDGDSTKYYVHYSYIANDSRKQGRSSVGSTEYRKLKVGQNIPIHYSSRNPSLVEYGDRRSIPISETGTVVAICGVLWNVVIIGLVFFLAGQANKLDLLSRKGTVVYGQIIEIFGAPDSDDDYNVTLKYRFTTSTGQTVTHQEKRQRNDLKTNPFPLPKPGTPVAVIHTDEKKFVVL